MKKKYFLMAVAAVFLMATIASCGKSKSTPTSDADATEQSVEADDGLDSDVEAFITDMYNNGRYDDYDFLRAHCTPSMLKKLADEYDYDDEGYATWLFRTTAQDSAPNPEGNGVVSVSRQGDWYHYQFLDGGWHGENRIKIVKEDGQLKIADLERVYDEAQEAGF